MDFDEDPDYLDLDDILAQTQTVNCRFLMSIPGLEFLSPGKDQEVKQSIELLLPFWMAKTLYTYSMIDLKLPKCYAAKFREILEPEPEVVDLHKAGPHYYRFGKLLINLRREKGNSLDPFTQDGQRNKFRREEGETIEDRRAVAESLMKTFSSRRHKLIECSINPASSENHKSVRAFEEKLDNMEKKLLRIGRKQLAELVKWKSREIEMIRNNQIAEILNKRRKLESNSKSKIPNNSANNNSNNSSGS